MKTRPAPRPKRRSRAELEAEIKSLESELENRRTRLETEALQQAQTEAEASRDHYAELYDFAPFGHLTLDRFGIIRTLNLTAAGLVGRSRSHVVGYPFNVLVAPGDRRRAQSFLSRLRRSHAHEPVELELRNAKGAFVAVQMVGVVRVSNRRSPLEIQLALVDISERKRAEARTAALARLGLMLSAAADPPAAAQAVADTALEFCGWDACFLLVHDGQTDTVSDLINVDMVDGRRTTITPMLHHAPPTPLIRKVLEEGPQLILRRSEQEKGALTCRFGNKGLASLSLMFVPIRLEGKSIGVLSVQSYQANAYAQRDLETLQFLGDHVAGALARLQAQAELRHVNEKLEQRVVERTVELRQYRDHLEELVKQRTADLENANKHLRREVTHRQHAEESLLRAAKDLKRSNLDLEQFAYVASHDLQEPLRAVGGYVRLLEHRFPDKVDAKAREYIAGASDGAVRMERLITDLLALSRVSTGGRAFTEVNLELTLQKALRTLQFNIREAHASVTHDPLPTVPVDETQIVQLFQNLIGNAVKFGKEGAPEIHIGARAEEHRWIISVKDNGIGIAPEYFERIFQVFQRLHTRKKYPGTGVGLAICRRIVERHGGQIWVESQPDAGATFFFSLPKAEVSPPEHQPPAATPAPA